MGNPGVAAAGGLVRDSAGRWLVGYMAHLGNCTNNVAELQAIRYGLELAWMQGYRKVICEVDAQLVLDYILKADTSIHPCGGLIEDIRVLLRRRVSVATHFARGEFCSGLAKEACSMDEDFELLENPPACVLQWLQADERGIQFYRGWGVNLWGQAE